MFAGASRSRRQAPLAAKQFRLAPKQFRSNFDHFPLPGIRVPAGIVVPRGITTMPSRM